VDTSFNTTIFCGVRQQNTIHRTFSKILFQISKPLFQSPDGDIPTYNVENRFTAFDLNAGAGVLLFPPLDHWLKKLLYTYNLPMCSSKPE